MSLSLRINIVERNVTKTINFDPSTTIYDACKIIREKCAEEFEREPKDYGLFLTDTDNKMGVWLESNKYLDFYLLRNGDILEYRKKMRTLRVKMLDGSVKTMLVDDSQIVANLMVVICTKIGITNHDEYSLVLEDQEQENNADNRNYGTLTLKRRKEEKDRDVKMDQLRKKIRTDDEVNWVDPSKTLREQGIDETETVLLRRKFFFSDQNIDSRDPIQLNLLYVQARDAILDGTHPVTNDKACEFAGIQCQIQFGDHSDTKHKAGLLDLKDFLPISYQKVKGIEKKVFSEHKKHIGSNELDAKVLYTKTARDLSTYGVTFFLVKEKMSGKNKLVPRLLGVTKESILRLDEKTKEIMKTWPLTQVRRWGASPNTFTLDFGDYADQYYSVHTTEGERIQQIIAGYIDIILKKKVAKDHLGIEGDEGSTMVEDSVSPHKATILQHESTKIAKVNTESLAKPAVMRAGSEGWRPYGTGHVGGAQFTTVSGQVNVAHQPPSVQQTKVTSVLSEPQQALLSTIHETQYKIKQIKLVQEIKPEIGSDPAAKKWKQVTLDTRKQYVGSQIAAMNAATAQVVTLTSGPPDEVDHTAVEAAITTIGSNLPEMTDDVKMIAALMDDTNMGDKLLDATRKLVTAFSDLLKAAEPESKEPRQTLLNAASRVGEASKQVLETITVDSPENKELHDILLSLAKAVANSTAALILKAKNIAAGCDEQQTQNKVIGAATQCALVTSQLVACAKLLAPTLQAPACQEQITAAVREVARAVDNLVHVCNDSYKHDDELMHKLRDAATEVTRTLNDMLNHIKYAGASPKRAVETTQESNVDVICTTTDKLLAASGDSGEMVKQARILGQATAQLIQSIKGEAERQPENSDIQRRLLAAAKTLADATARMVEAARQCGTHPQDAKYQDNLLHTAEYLRDMTMVAASTTALRAKLVDRVNICARRAVATATQCVSSAQASHPHNTNDSTKEQLMEDTQELAHQIPPLIESIQMNTSLPDNSNNQVQLMYVAEVFLHPANHFIQSSRAVLPTVTNQSVSQQLSSTTQQLNTDLTELRSAISCAQPACYGLGLNAASQLINDLHEEIREFERAVDMHNLKPLPGDSAERGTVQLGTFCKQINQSVAQMLSATSQGNENYTTQAARETAQNLRGMTGAIRTIAATTDDEETQKHLIDAGKDVILHSARLVGEAIRVFQTPDIHITPLMNSEAKEISRTLEGTINCLPGQRDVDMAITCIKEWSNTIEHGRFPSTRKNYGELQNELNEAAANLNDASTEVVVTAANSVQLAASSKEFSSAFHELLQVSMEMAGQTQDDQTRGQMVQSLKHVSTVSSNLLTTAKSYSADPSAPNAKNQLAAAARAVTDSINGLLDVYTSATPGQSECDNAIRRLQALKPMLTNPSEPINEWSYYDCLDAITERSKVLGDGLIGMKTGAETSDHERFAKNVRIVSDCICTLAESAAQSAYLVGIADRSSVAGRPGVLDQGVFARASQGIRHACDVLASPHTTRDHVYDAVQQIAAHTSALCKSCRTAAEKTTNPVAKRQFVQSARDVAINTSDLVTAIKNQNMESPEARRGLANVAKPMLATVDNVCLYAGSSEFVSVPAKISAKGRQAQQPIVDAGRSVIDSSCAVISSIKSLAAMPRDPPIWQQFASHSKQVSDSIKRLVDSIKDKAPGQAECDSAESALKSYLRVLNTTTMDAVQQRLTKRGPSAVACNEQVTRAASELIDTVGPIQQSAKSDGSGQLGHHVDQLVQYFEPLINGTIAAASHMTNSKQQEFLLSQAKSVAESARQLVYVTKDCGGNPKAAELYPELDEAANTTREALRDLVRNLEMLSAQSGAVSGAVDSLTRSMTRLNDNRASLILSDGSFVDFQTSMVGYSKDIAKIAGEMSNKAVTEPKRLPQLSSDLSQRYAKLSEDSIGAAAVSTNGEVAALLKESVQALGGACIDLVKAGGDCQMRRDDISLQNINECSRNVIEKVSRVLATLQSGSRGTQACINAACTVSGIIGDLDTTIMFATAGNLNPENENESFADHRENILKTAKALVEDTKTLVTGAASSQENLAVAAQNAVTTIVQLAEVVKFGAASLGSDNSDSQVMLINAVKDVASALGDLIHATKAASGKAINDPAMTHLRDTSKVMVTNVTSLLKTVKAVENEHTRGTRALESTIEAIGQEMRAIHMNEGTKAITPEDLVRCTKAITKATAKSVSAGISNKQDDIISAANLSRRAISDMLVICKSAAFNLAETTELRQRTLAAGQDCAHQYRELLIAILQGNTADAKQTLPLLSRRIAQAVTELVSVAELLKGSDWEDPDDPTVIAENELLGAAASIDAAAKKLASLRPRVQKAPNEPDESMNFDEMILEAAKSIAAATSALVKAASAAQRELIDSGKVSRTPLTSSDDGQWSEGLISAARLVAAATHSLVESANNLVQGVASEEKLISSAKQVASSTAHLLVACKVKAEGDTEATRRLQSAGNAVIRSTDNLVRAAQRAISIEEERSLVLNKRMVGGIAQEINARSEVLRMERQLEEARAHLTAIRQAKYKLKGEGTTSGEDTDGYMSGTQFDGSSRYERNLESPQYNKYTGYGYVSDGQDCHIQYNETLSTNIKPLLSHINALDSAVYGATNSYNQNIIHGHDLYGSILHPNLAKSPQQQSQNGNVAYASLYSPQPPDTPTRQSLPRETTSYPRSPTKEPSYPRSPATTIVPSKEAFFASSPTVTSTPINTFGKPYTAAENVSPKLFAGDADTKKSLDATIFTTTSGLGASAYPDGYTSKESNTSTCKIPGGYKTVTNKYESYHGSSEPMSYTTSEKYYTSGPSADLDSKSLFAQTVGDNKSFQPYMKNGSGGSDYQSNYSSTTEIVNEPLVFKDSDTLEQKMLKKSVTQQVSEKKTVQVIKSSKQESSSKTFKFE